MDLLSRVTASLRRQGLGSSGDRVLVALSGGSDSVALLHLLFALARDGGPAVAGAAHLNHGLRGNEADEDEAFCAALAQRLGVPFIADRVDVADLARRQHRSLEDAARVARYRFLDAAAERLGATAIAVGHTRDDQAETFLLRLLRGSGTRGLSAIQPRAGTVVRPLLDISREELRSYLAERGEPYREDSSNQDVAILRNRVRHELMPLLESRFSPAITDVLAREAALARQDEDFLRHQAIETARTIVLTSDGDCGEGLRIDARALRSTPRALGSRVAHDVLCHLAGSRPVSFDHVQRLLALAALENDGRDGAMVSLPGQHALRQGDVIFLRPGRGRDIAANSFEFPLSIPGEVASPEGWAIAAELMATEEVATRRYSAKGPEVAVAAAAVRLPLGIRNRRPGDRFHPLGAPGVRKLQDFLVDRKVPRKDRDSLPLVVDAGNRIVWVAGLSVGEGFRVLEPAQGVILLKVKRLGGPG
jgi:tRNA(Ile)-lysidine synthase